MTQQRRQPDEAYRLAWEWLLKQEDGVRRDLLIIEVNRQARKILNDDSPAETPKHGYSPNCLITFEKLGLLLSEDEKGLIYAWIPEQSTLSQTWQ